MKKKKHKVTEEDERGPDEFRNSSQSLYQKIMFINIVIVINMAAAGRSSYSSCCRA
jgi:hypothetical protein